MSAVSLSLLLPTSSPLCHHSSQQSEMILHRVVVETKLPASWGAAFLPGLRILSVQLADGKRTCTITYECKPEITFELFPLEYICYIPNH